MRSSVISALAFALVASSVQAAPVETPMGPLNRVPLGTFMHVARDDGSSGALFVGGAPWIDRHLPREDLYSRFGRVRPFFPREADDSGALGFGPWRPFPRDVMDLEDLVARRSVFMVTSCALAGCLTRSVSSPHHGHHGMHKHKGHGHHARFYG